MDIVTTSTISKTKIRNAIGYVRVSTSKQAKKGTSFDVQAKNIMTYVDDYNHKNPDNPLNLLDTVYETGSASKISNKKYQNNSLLTDRPKLRSIIDSIQIKQITDLIIYSRDRFTRSFAEYIALKTLLHTLNVTIHFSNTAEKTSSTDKAMDNFFELMISNMSMLEARLIGQRVKLGLLATASKGYYTGGFLPLGYDLETNKLTKKKYLSINEEEKIIVRRIFKLYSLGNSYSSITKILKDEFPGKQPIKFSLSTISQILNNKTYTGTFIWNKHSKCQLGFQDNPIVARPIADIKIIEPAEFKIIENIKSMNSKKNSKKLSTPFLLKDILICGCCGEPLKTKNNGINKTSVYYCKCQNDNNKWSLSIPKILIEEYTLTQLKNSFEKILSKDRLLEYYASFCSLSDKRRKDLKILLDSIELKLSEIKFNINEATEVLDNKVKYEEKNSELYNDSLFNIIQSTITCLNIENEDILKQKKSIEEKLEIKVISFENFKTNFENLKNQLFSVRDSTEATVDKNRLSRMFLLQLIEKIIVNKTEYGETLTIYINVPLTIPSFTIKLPHTCPINH